MNGIVCLFVTSVRACSTPAAVAALACLLGLAPVDLARGQSDSISTWDAAEFRSWSFVPYWTSQSQLNSFATDDVYDHVSDVLYFSGVGPTATGGLTYRDGSVQHLTTLKNHAAQEGFDLHMSMFDVAPGGDVDAIWRSVIASSRYRANFVHSVKNLLQTYDMKGFNFDWERPTTDTEWANYTQLAKDLRATIEPLGMEISVDDYGFADSDWDDTPVFDARTYDQLFIMGYHYPAYGNGSLNNNTFANTKLNLTGQGEAKTFKDEQLVLGIGTWGVRVGGGSLKTMKDIAAASPNLPYNAGTYTNGSGTWTIESREQVRAKVELALDRDMAGVMFWTLHYDATNKLNLHRVAHHYTAFAREIPDLNLDGSVNGADANALADNMGSVPGWTGTNTAARFDDFYMSGNWEAGDRDGNGFVNQQDADWLAARFTVLGVNLPDRLAYSGTFENFHDSVGLDGRWRAARDTSNNLSETGNFAQHAAGHLSFSVTGPGAEKHSSAAVTLRNQNAAEAFDSLNTAPRVMEVDLAAPIDLAQDEEAYFTFLVRQNTGALLASQQSSFDRTLTLEFLDDEGENQFDFSFHDQQQQFGINPRANGADDDVTTDGFGADSTYLFVGKIAGNGDGANTLHASLFADGAEVGRFTRGDFEWMLEVESAEDFNPVITQLRWQSLFEANYTVSNVWLGPSSSFFTPLPAELGDFNDDDIVDAADYTVWRDTLGQTVDAGTGADGDFDGVIGAGDYSIWKANFGATIGNGASARSDFAVPEPATYFLLVFSTFLFGFHLRTR